jgi:hypothetical protein
VQPVGEATRSAFDRRSSVDFTIAKIKSFALDKT